MSKASTTSRVANHPAPRAKYKHTYVFAYKNNTYDSAVTIGSGIGAGLAEMTDGHKRSLMILGIGGAVATWLFVTALPGAAGTGRTLAACGIVMATLAVGAIAEGKDS